MSPLGTLETFGRDVRMSARGETGHCGNIVVGPNLTDAVEKVFVKLANHDSVV
jgi:hypothetical protein